MPPPPRPRSHCLHPQHPPTLLKKTLPHLMIYILLLALLLLPQVNPSSIPLKESRNSRQSPLPSTSNSTNIEQIILDLQLSDLNDSPYVDSESSYHPENNKPATSSDTSRDEIEETNVRKKVKKQTWKRNIAKNKRQNGKSYINRKGVYKCTEDKTRLRRDYDEHKAREKESLEMKAYDKKKA
ncbi:unnamed protein product [Parnassius apollo]|uniref:(apollo) hypothetical protein n=1 Tax=Parnassius apollo TaxID=110799 RepID=A0A8S3W6L9_PARAO|nr:unnamed protein product [Parnassius apollo]